MNEASIDKPAINHGEAVPLASEMHRALGDAVAALETHWNLSRADAIAKAHDADAAEIKPPAQLTWLDLYFLSRHSPALSEQRWDEVQRAARSELQSGHRAASIVEQPGASSCWIRARILALRAELLDGWQPRNSVERLLIDSLAQAQCQYEHWLELLTVRTMLQSVLDAKDDGRWTAPRLTDAEAVEQAAEMVDRFHKIIVRTIRTIQNLRRHAPVVMVQNARQVNVGQQQINAVAGR